MVLVEVGGWWSWIWCFLLGMTPVVTSPCTKVCPEESIEGHPKATCHSSYLSSESMWSQPSSKHALKHLQKTSPCIGQPKISSAPIVNVGVRFGGVAWIPVMHFQEQIKAESWRMVTCEVTLLQVVSNDTNDSSPWQQLLNCSYDTHWYPTRWQNTQAFWKMEDPWRSMKIHEDPWRSMKIHEDPWRSHWPMSIRLAFSTDFLEFGSCTDHTIQHSQCMFQPNILHWCVVDVAPG